MSLKVGRVRPGLVLMAVLAVGVALLSALAPVSSLAVADASTGTAGIFVPAQGRILDTRNGTGGYSAPLTASSWTPVTVAGLAGVPSAGVSSVQITLTAVAPSAAGLVSVSPDVASPHGGTALYYRSGDTGSFSNTAIVAVAADGKIVVTSTTSIDLLIDVQGYYTSGGSVAAGGFAPVTQARIANTSNGTNVPQAKVVAGNTLTVQAGGVAGVPADASAVFVDISLINYSTPSGWLAPSSNGDSGGTSLNFPAGTAAGITTAIGTTVPLASDGSFQLYVGPVGSNIHVDMAIDVEGYFDGSVGGGGFTPASTRVLDTRTPSAPIAANATVSYQVSGVNGVPAMSSGIGAVFANLQVINGTTTGGGYLRIWPTDQAEPAGTSNLNYLPNSVRSNTVSVQLSADGKVSIHNVASFAINLVIDVQGWYANPVAPPLVASDQYPQDATSASSPVAAVFEVSADSPVLSPVSSFQWALDGGTVSTVAASQNDDLALATFTPSAVATSASGSHTMAVTAINSHGRRSTTTTYTWTVGDPGVDSGQAPQNPIVTSTSYPEDQWSPATSNASFDIDATNQDPPVTSLTYAMDDAADTTLSASSAHLVLASPTTSGAHVLHVSATNAQGYSTYDYAFYLGAVPTSVTNVAVTPGQSSALVSWSAATISSGTITGYDLQLIGTSGVVTDLGNCGSCTSVAVTGLDTSSYSVRVTPNSDAGPAPSMTSSSFTVPSTGTAAACGSASCTQLDASCLLATCDTSNLPGDPVYSATYIAADGSSAAVTAASSATPQILTRATDGTAGVAGNMVLAGNLNISVTPSNSPDSTVTPQARTPAGYTLHGNNRVDAYRYRSEYGLMEITASSRGKKYLVGAVKAQMRETLNGGNSTRWIVEAVVSYAGGDPYSFYYLYNCGINVPKQDDWTCRTHEADADGTWDHDVVHETIGTITENHNASFGSTETRYAKFPLVAYRTTYQQGGYSVSTQLYYRGWDIRKVKNTWVMAPVSGTGH